MRLERTRMGFNTSTRLIAGTGIPGNERLRAPRQRQVDSSVRSARTGLRQSGSASTGGKPALLPLVHDVLQSPGQPLDSATRAFMETRFGHDFSKIPVHPGRTLSGSLNSLAALASRQIMLSNPGDACEQEADRAASLVVKNGDSVRSPRVLKERQRPPFEKGSSEGPLDTAVGESLEPNFGYDFSAVRVHTNAKAAASARALHADAYAIGRDIVFAEGRYTPQTSAGRFLLAHELAHVVQQANHPGPAIMRRGVTFRGFLANIFHFWDYSKETLDEYLHVLDT